MKIFFKIIISILFSLASLIFVLLLLDNFIVFSTERSEPNPVGSALSAFVFYAMIGLGVVISIFLLFVQKKSYVYQFFSMAIVALTLFIGFHVNNNLNKAKEKRDLLANSKASQVFEDIHKNIDNSNKAVELLESIKGETEHIEKQKAAVYLLLAIKNEKNMNLFLDKILLPKKDKKYFLSHLFDLYSLDLASEKELLKLFEILERNQYTQALKESYKLSFKKFIARGQYEVALYYLSLLTLNTQKAIEYISIAKSVKNETTKSRLIIEILNRTNNFFTCITNCTNTCLHVSPIVLAIKDENNFQKLIYILTQKLKNNMPKDVIIKARINQKNQEEFIQMYNLLGETHPLIKLIPKSIIESYLKQEKNILKHGRDNYILYYDFLSQVVGDINHNHGYHQEWYRIYSNGKIVHEGRSNRYGCITYKAYGAKATDTIEVETALFGKNKQQVGWISLLPLWDTPKGMKERAMILGVVGIGEFNKQKAEKIQNDFDSYIDIKFCE